MIQSVKTITFTGVDDYTPAEAYREITSPHFFVEWGVLYSPKRQGSGRYPAEPLSWLKKLPCTALHLCGEASRSVCQGVDFEGAVEAAIATQSRIQLNGYRKLSPEFLNAVVDSWREAHFILQCRNRGQLIYAVEDVEAVEKRGGHASLLYDPSGGQGKQSNLAVSSTAPFGIAGGIGPDNIGEMIRVGDSKGAQWVDMESRVRTDDKLDLSLVREVIAGAESARVVSIDTIDLPFNIADAQGVRPLITCGDGFTISVQASRTHYCQPRDNVGPYSSVEVWCASEPEPLLDPYGDGETPYGYVPSNVVAAIVEKHGGVVRGELPPLHLETEQ